MTIATLLLFGVLAGLDNLQVCAGLGLLALERRQKHSLAAAFLVCELGMALLGFTVARGVLGLFQPFARVLPPLLTLLCGATVLASSLKDKAALSPDSTFFAFGLPLSLSFDNLFAGAAAGTWPCGALAASLSIGLVGGVLSCLGLYGAAWLRQRLPSRLTSRADTVIGAYLCLLALRMFVGSGF
jgi:putative Mn2+ efflux pump MntP